MRRRALGRSGIEIPVIVFGGNVFGWTADRDASFRLLDACLEHGLVAIDTADVYSVWAPGHRGGESETMIGEWLKARPGMRERVLILTKCGMEMPGRGKGLSPAWIARAAEDSLRRLGVERIDLYQAHWVDNQTPIEETLEALTELVRRGYVRYIGASNYSAWRLMQALWTSDKKGLESFVSLQPEYSLLSPTRANFERELARVCVEYGLGVLPWSPLGGGMLTGKYKRGGPLPDSVRAEGNARGRFSDRNFDIVETLEAVAARHGAKPAQVALAWLLAQPGVTAPIVGANSVAQLTELLGTLSLTLDADDLAELSRVSDWERARTELER